MKWLRRVEPSDRYWGRPYEIPPPRPIRIKRLDTSGVPSGDLSLLEQYFLSTAVLEDATVHYQPQVLDPDMQQMIHAKLLPHFQQAKAVYVEGVYTSLVLHDLKPESVAKFHQLIQFGQLDPFVRDLRGTHPKDVSYRYDVPKELHWYQVMKDELEPAHHDSFPALWDFLLKTCDTADTGALIFSPTDWLLEDHLSDSIALRLISQASKHTYLAVDPRDNRINWINCLID